MCPFQRLRYYKRHEEKKRKIGQERSSIQQAHYQSHRPTPWMQESVSMHKSPSQLRHSCMNQARSEEEEQEFIVYTLSVDSLKGIEFPKVPWGP